jgi:hypothetical protein
VNAPSARRRERAFGADRGRGLRRGTACGGFREPAAAGARASPGLRGPALPDSEPTTDGPARHRHDSGRACSLLADYDILNRYTLESKEKSKSDREGDSGQEHK